MSSKGKDKGKAIATKGKPAKRKRDDDKTGGRKRINRAVLQFFEDAADEASDYDTSDFEEDFPDDEDETPKEQVEPGKPRQLPVWPKEEELSGDELERVLEERYKSGSGYVTYAEDDYETKRVDTNIVVPSAQDPVIWKVKCKIGRERHSIFCLMQKYVDLKSIGTKLQIVSAFSVEHARGYIFVEANKQYEVMEACKQLPDVYYSMTNLVPSSEISQLLAVRRKQTEVSKGMWVRLKNGHYKGDLAQVIGVGDSRKKATVKLIPRVDFQALAAKFGAGSSTKRSAIPKPRLITPSDLEEFQPLIQYRRDRDTGMQFEVLDNLMLKDGFLFKKVAIDSLRFCDVNPSVEELQKFRTSNNEDSGNMEFLSELYGDKKEKCTPKPLQAGEKGEGTSGSKDPEDIEVHNLVLFGKREFGMVLGMEKDESYKILKYGSDGSIVVSLAKKDLKNLNLEKKFNALDHRMKTISFNDVVKVLDGPLKDKEGVVKQIYRGIIFLYDQNDMEDNAYFCAKSQSCERVKHDVSCLGKDGVAGSSGFEDMPSSPKTPLSPEKPWQSEEQNRNFNRREQEGGFTVGQSLRIRVGPLKGYLCRVLAVRRSDVTVKLDSRSKVLTVKSEHLSEVRGKSFATSTCDDTGLDTSKPFDFLGNNDSGNDWMASSVNADRNENGQSSEGGWPAFTSSTSAPWGASSMDLSAPTAAEDDPWQKKTSTTLEGASGWGQDVVKDLKLDDATQTGGWATVGRSDEKSPGKAAWDSGNTGSSGWGQQKSVEKVNADSSWGKPSETDKNSFGADGSSWGKSAANASDADGAWGKSAANASDADGAWGKPAGNASTAEGGSWGKSAGNASDAEGAWGKSTGNASDAEDAWGKPAGNASAAEGAWGKPAGSASAAEGGSWGKPAGNPTSAEGSSWGKSGGNDGGWGNSSGGDAGGGGGWGNSGGGSGDGGGRGQGGFKGGQDQAGGRGRGGSFGGGGQGTEGNEVFIKGIDQSLDQNAARSALQDHFGGCGEITRVSVPKDFDSGAIKGIAFIGFADTSGVEKALQLNGEDLGGSSLYVGKAKARGESGGNSGAGKSDAGGWGNSGGSGGWGSSAGGKSETGGRGSFGGGGGGGVGEGSEVFVKGIDQSLDQNAARSALQEHFGSCGAITRVSVPKDFDSGAIKGIAFIGFEDSNGVEKALQLNNSELGGSSLYVGKAKPRGETGGSSGGGGTAGWGSSGGGGTSGWGGSGGGTTGGWGSSGGAGSTGWGSSDGGAKTEAGGGSGGEGGEVFVKGIDQSLDQNAARSALQEHFGSCGAITRVSVPKDFDSGAIKGIAFIGFEDSNGLEKALQLNNSELGGSSLYVGKAKPRGETGGSSGGGGTAGWGSTGGSSTSGWGSSGGGGSGGWGSSDGGAKTEAGGGSGGEGGEVFIKGIDQSLDQNAARSALQEHFGSCGAITKVSVPKDFDSGAIKGIAFIAFSDSKGLENALQLNGADLGGSSLYVGKAKPRGDGGGGSSGGAKTEAGGWGTSSGGGWGSSGGGNNGGWGSSDGGSKSEAGDGGTNGGWGGSGAGAKSDTGNGGWGSSGGAKSEAVGGGWGTSGGAKSEAVGGGWGTSGGAKSEAAGGGWGTSSGAKSEAASGGWGTSGGAKSETAGGGWGSSGGAKSETAGGGWGSSGGAKSETAGGGWGSSGGAKSETGGSQGWGNSGGWKSEAGGGRGSFGGQANEGSEVFVKGIDQSLDQSAARIALQEHFKACGEITRVSVPKDHDSGAIKGIAFVGFADANGVEQALLLNGADLGGSSLYVGKAKPRGESAGNSTGGQGGGRSFGGGGQSSGGNEVFVKGIDQSLDQNAARSALQEHFGSCGAITRVSVPKDYDSGAIKGIAFIGFEDSNGVEKALQLNNSELGGSSLYVGKAKPRGETGGSSGGGSTAGWGSSAGGSGGGGW